MRMNVLSKRGVRFALLGACHVGNTRMDKGRATLFSSKGVL